MPEQIIEPQAQTPEEPEGIITSDQVPAGEPAPQVEPAPAVIGAEDVPGPLPERPTVGGPAPQIIEGMPDHLKTPPTAEDGQA